MIAEHGNALQPMEIKSGATINSDFFTGIQRWCALCGGGRRSGVAVVSPAGSDARAQNRPQTATKEQISTSGRDEAQVRGSRSAPENCGTENKQFARAA